MERRVVNGEEALALAAKDENIALATGYPGSPGGGIISLLMEMQLENVQVHWSANEKIAIEKGIGVAINKKKALVCVKSVGLNAMLDPLTVVNITPLNGALVIVVGDDPGAYGSQNDQDSRNLAPFINLPWLEPISPQNGYDLLRKAFKISQNYALPVFLRITRSYAMHKGDVIEHKSDLQIPHYHHAKVASPRFVPVPNNAVAKQHELNLRISTYEKDMPAYGLHQRYGKNCSSGLIVCGHLVEKVTQVASLTELEKHFNLLFLQAIYPLPPKVIHDFLLGLKSVLVIEENTPVVTQQLKVIAANKQISLAWEVFAHPGEVFRWEISNLLQQKFPGLVVDEKFNENNSEKPILESNCKDCRYDEVLTILETCAKSIGGEAKFYGDPGCLVSVSDRLKAKYAMGGSVSTVFGAQTADSSIFNIALIGDSGFFHSALLSIIDAAYHGADIAMVLLNNNGAKTTGGQQHAGSLATSNVGDLIKYQSLLAHCGVKTFAQINLNEDRGEIITKTTRLLEGKGLRLLQIDIDPK